MGLDGGRIAHVAVIRGAPCGATWEAVQRIVGLPTAEAVAHIGLAVQFSCVADPAGWDPLHGKSPVHFAGNVHAAALRRALGMQLPAERDA